MEIALLSQHPDLLNDCAELLNKQWKRSSSARIQSLEKSLTQLPDSLLLIEKNEDGRHIIGHSRLTRVLEDPYGCWIGSVVISEEKRRKGFGKYLMQKTEEYAKSLQFSTAYLNTQDQQGFYEHLGYIYCDPVSSISFALNGNFPRIINFCNVDQNKNLKQQSLSYNNINIHHNSCSSENGVPPPPPPLPSKSGSYMSNSLKSNLGQYWMKKKL